MRPEATRLVITPTEHVTALTYPAGVERRGDVCVVLAHGAGTNQTHEFMVRFATALAERGINVVTFNFVYSESGRRLPDRNDKLEACYRKVIEAFQAGQLRHAGTRLVIGGKSMGGRIASQVAAASPDGIAGLLFLGYPLHSPGRPEQLRSRHLPRIRVPMLFVQGSRDAFGTPEELAPVLKNLSAAELCIVDGADHSLKVRKTAAMSQDTADAFVLDTIEGWLRRIPRANPR